MWKLRIDSPPPCHNYSSSRRWINCTYFSPRQFVPSPRSLLHDRSHLIPGQIVGFQPSPYFAVNNNLWREGREGGEGRKREMYFSTLNSKSTPIIYILLILGSRFKIIYKITVHLIDYLLFLFPPPPQWFRGKGRGR